MIRLADTIEREETAFLGQLAQNDRDAYVHVPTDLEWIPNEAFNQPETEHDLFGPSSPQVQVPTWVDRPEAQDDQPTPRTGRRRLKPSEEVMLFLRYNYARFRTSRLLKAQRAHPSLARARQIILWYRRAMQIRSDLVSANMPLVLAMAKRTQIPGVDFTELVSEGSLALLRSVEKFDVSRGFKFSTYACRAILKSYNRLATRTGTYRQRFPVEFDPDLEQIDHNQLRYERQQFSAVEALQEVLDGNLAHLDELEQTVIRERYALDSGGRKRTLRQVGQIVGLTNERVRQIQNRAFGKIRQALQVEESAD